jgi:hypothetical protein
MAGIAEKVADRTRLTHRFGLLDRHAGAFDPGKNHDPGSDQGVTTPLTRLKNLFPPIDGPDAIFAEMMEALKAVEAGSTSGLQSCNVLRHSRHLHQSPL